MTTFQPHRVQKIHNCFCNITHKAHDYGFVFNEHFVIIIVVIMSERKREHTACSQSPFWSTSFHAVSLVLRHLTFHSTWSTNPFHRTLYAFLCRLELRRDLLTVVIERPNEVLDIDWYCSTVCLSVTYWYCMKTTKQIVIIVSPPDSLISLVICDVIAVCPACPVPVGCIITLSALRCHSRWLTQLLIH